MEVIEGELMNLQGKVLAVDGSKITIQPKHEDLKDPLEFQVILLDNICIASLSDKLVLPEINYIFICLKTVYCILVLRSLISGKRIEKILSSG